MANFGYDVAKGVHNSASDRNLAGLPQVPWSANPNSLRLDCALPSPSSTSSRSVDTGDSTCISPRSIPHQQSKQSRFFSAGYYKHEPTPRLMADQIYTRARKIKQHILDQLAAMDDIATEGGLELVMKFITQAHRVDEYMRACMEVEEEIDEMERQWYEGLLEAWREYLVKKRKERKEKDAEGGERKDSVQKLSYADVVRVGITVG